MEGASAGAAPRRPPRGGGRFVAPVVLLGIVVTTTVYVFLTFKPYEVPQKGMYPSIEPGAMVVGRMRPYDGAADVERGDLVVFSHDKKDFIWRVVGLPGEEIALVDDVVSIDGERFQRVRLREEGPFAVYREQFGDASWTIALPEPAADPKKANMPPVKLGDDELFLLGDNRHNAFDSRETGPVPFRQIVARIVYP